MLQFAPLDPVANPLMARIEASRVAAHCDDAGLLLHAHQSLGIGEIVGNRNLDHHMLAGAHAHLTLGGMHLRRRGEDRRLDAGLLQAFGQVGRPMRDAEFFRDLLGGLGPPAGERDHFNAWNIAHRFEMLDAESALPGQTDLHRCFPNLCFSRMICPSAVLETGTWWKR